MDSIAVIKPHMAVLSQERLLLSPFGALTQAFVAEILARAEQEEGEYSRVPLELLEEGEPVPAVQIPAPVIQVDLRLVLEALGKEPQKTEQVKTTERIVERILQLQRERKDRTEERRKALYYTEKPAIEEKVFLGDFCQTLHFGQNIRLLFAPSGKSTGGQDKARHSLAGRLGRRSMALSWRYPRTWGEGCSFLSGAWAALPEGGPAGGGLGKREGDLAFPDERAISREMLSFLKESRPADPMAETTRFSEAELIRSAGRAADFMLRGWEPGKAQRSLRLTARREVWTSPVTVEPGPKQENSLPGVSASNGESPGVLHKSAGNGQIEQWFLSSISSRELVQLPDIEEGADLFQSPKATMIKATEPKGLQRGIALQLLAGESHLGTGVTLQESSSLSNGSRKAARSPSDSTSRFLDLVYWTEPGNKSDATMKLRMPAGDFGKKYLEQRGIAEKGRLLPVIRDVRMGQMQISYLEFRMASNRQPALSDKALSHRIPFQPNHWTEEGQGTGREGSKSNVVLPVWLPERLNRKKPLHTDDKTHQEHLTAQGPEKFPTESSLSIEKFRSISYLKADTVQRPKGNAAKLMPGIPFELVYRPEEEGEIRQEKPGAGLVRRELEAEKRGGKKALQGLRETLPTRQTGQIAGEPGAGHSAFRKTGTGAWPKDVQVGGAEAPGTGPHTGADGWPAALSMIGWQTASLELAHQKEPVMETSQQALTGVLAGEMAQFESQTLGWMPRVKPVRRIPDSARDVRMNRPEISAQGGVPAPEQQNVTMGGALIPTELVQRVEMEAERGTYSGKTSTISAERKAQSLTEEASFPPSIPQMLLETLRNQREIKGVAADSLITVDAAPSELNYRRDGEVSPAVAGAPDGTPSSSRLRQSRLGPQKGAFSLALARDIRTGQPEGMGLPVWVTEGQPERMSMLPDLGQELIDQITLEGAMAVPEISASTARRREAELSVGTVPFGAWTPQEIGRTMMAQHLQTAQKEPLSLAELQLAEGRKTPPLWDDASPSSPTLVYRTGERMEWKEPQTSGEGFVRSVEQQRGQLRRGAESWAGNTIGRDIRVVRRDPRMEVHSMESEPENGMERSSSPGFSQENRGEHHSGSTSWGVGPGPFSLTYGPGQSIGTAPDSAQGEESQVVHEPAESDYVRRLPDWARRFLRESGTQGRTLGEREMGVARNIVSSLTEPEETVEWTAPNYQPPAPMAYREQKKESVPKVQQEMRISEGELQRAADRVYHIIEERIRQERRRLGL